MVINLTGKVKTVIDSGVVDDIVDLDSDTDNVIEEEATVQPSVVNLVGRFSRVITEP